MKERNHEIFMQSPGSQYLVMPGKLLLTVCIATTSVNRRINFTVTSKKKRGLHRQKARIHIKIRRVDLNFV